MPVNVRQWLDKIRRRDDPWIDMADRVLAGKADKCSTSELQALYIGMRRSRQPECVRAVERIKSHKDFSNVPWQKIEDPSKWRR